MQDWFLMMCWILRLLVCRFHSVPSDSVNQFRVCWDRLHFNSQCSGGVSPPLGEFPNRFRELNTLGPGQNGRHFADIFTGIILNEHLWISKKISLKYIPYSLINKPLSEPDGPRLHMRVIRPQSVKKSRDGECPWWLVCREFRARSCQTAPSSNF